MRSTAVIAWSIVLFSTVSARAERMEVDKMPPVLRDWVDWVLFDVPKRDCVPLDGEPNCVWPGRLSLDLDNAGGRFEAEVYADTESDVPLPGNVQLWPQEITLDGKPVVVGQTADAPSVRVLPGDHRVQGRFAWDVLPEGIDVPAGFGIVSLTVDGKSLPVARDESGKLWLASAVRSEDEEQLTLSVWRKITDGVPLNVETRIGIRASGKAREVTFDNVLLEGTAPLDVGGDLPVRLEPSGDLKLQIRPGNHNVYVTARSESAPSALVPKPHAGPWPTEEIWTWEANDALRQVTLSGAPGIDPSRTDLPEEWRNLPAFLISDKTALRFTVGRRGEIVAPPDRIELHRDLWMDLDGGGFSVRDSLTGTLNRTWRLDLEAKGILGRVNVDNEDRLITQNEKGLSGVELRRSELSMNAEWHTASAARDLPASGWSEDTASLDAVLHLPPGYSLLFAGGVDTARNTWWDKWNLFGFFFVLVVAAAAFKLTHPIWGGVALVGLCLSYHEPEVPVAAWPAVIIALALLKVLKEGKLRIAAMLIFSGTVLWLVAVLVPFAVYEIRTGLYPQVAQETSETHEMSLTFAAKAAPEATMEEIQNQLEQRQGSPNAPVVLSTMDSLSAGKKGGRGVQMDDKPAWLQAAAKQDPKAVVQTGMGLPAWRWNDWQLTWSGPVKKNHRMSLYLISPAMNLVLSFLRALLLCLFGISLILEGRRALRASAKPTGESSTSPGAVKAGAALLLIGAMLLPARGIAEANPMQEDAAVPPPDVLDTLRARLTAEPECRGDCISVSKLHINVAGDQITVTAEVHAEAMDAVILPGPAESWTPASVALDGRPSIAVVLRPDGFLHARVPKGIHKLTLTGSMPAVGALVLSLGLAPKQVSVQAEGWTVDGLRENNRAEGSLQFTRIVGASDLIGEKATEDSALPPWLEVTRDLQLGIPWTMQTTVERKSAVGSPILISVPLLSGESVTESELKVTANAVSVSMGRDDTIVSWTSTLKEQETLSLTAATKSPWSEVWRVACNPVWQCELEGIAPIARKTDGEFKPLFRPWPGEKVTMHIAKPEGVDGASITIDSANLSITPGTRLSDASLSLDIRTSRGGEQKFTLPEGAEIQTVTVDGSAYPFQQEGRTAILSLKTGKQTISLNWQTPDGLRTKYVVPEISLGRDAANVHVTVNLPSDRWLLSAGGPSWGPAVLFWGYLIAVLIAGFVLGRFSVSPLKSHQWMLLFAGLTQVPTAVAVIIVVWFLAFHRRKENPLERRVLFNLSQIGLAIWTATTIGCLAAAVYTGLAVQPDMQVRGMGSNETALIWYVDRAVQTLPTPWCISVPIVFWKAAMLAWALWLAVSTVKWSRFAWNAYSSGGIWRKKPTKRDEGANVSKTSIHPPLPNSGETTVS